MTMDRRYVEVISDTEGCETPQVSADDRSVDQVGQHYFETQDTRAVVWIGCNTRDGYGLGTSDLISCDPSSNKDVLAN